MGAGAALDAYARECARDPALSHARIAAQKVAQAYEEAARLKRTGFLRATPEPPRPPCDVSDADKLGPWR